MLIMEGFIFKTSQVRNPFFYIIFFSLSFLSAVSSPPWIFFFNIFNMPDPAPFVNDAPGSDSGIKKIGYVCWWRRVPWMSAMSAFVF